MSKELWHVDREHFEARFVVEDDVVTRAPALIATIQGMTLPNALKYLQQVPNTKINKIA